LHTELSRISVPVADILVKLGKISYLHRCRVSSSCSATCGYCIRTQDTVRGVGRPLHVQGVKAFLAYMGWHSLRHYSTYHHSQPLSQEPSRMSRSSITRVAVAQYEPEWLDLQKSVEKTCKIIDEAASGGAELVSFAEAFIPGYPAWIW
jgi:hypothetical protein